MQNKKEEIKKLLTLIKNQKISISLEEAVKDYPTKGQVYEGGKSFFVFSSNTNNCYGCAYCVLSGVDYIQEEKKSIVPDFRELNIGKVPSELHPALINIPVAINNAYGDAGIQWIDTLEKLTELEKAKHKGVVGIITKTGLNKRRAEQLRDYDLNLLVLQSLSGLSGIIEPVSYKKRIQGIENLSNVGVKTLLYFRPIIAGFNDSTKNIKKILHETSDVGITSMVYSGLMGTTDVLQLLEKNLGMKISPPVGYDQWQSGHKLVSKGKREEIESIARHYNIEPFRKTSCGVSHVMELPADYNVHYSKPNKYGCADCIKNIDCSSYASKDNKEDIISALDLLSATGTIETNDKEGECNLNNVCNNSCSSCAISKGTRLHLDGAYTEGELGMARWITGMTVSSDVMIQTNRIMLWEDMYVDRKVEEQRCLS